MSEDAKDFFNQAITTAFNQGYSKGYDEGYSTGHDEGYEEAWKAPNRPSNERNDGEWIVITTEEVRAEIGRIKDCMDDLYDRAKRLESVVFYGGKKA